MAQVTAVTILLWKLSTKFNRFPSTERVTDNHTGNAMPTLFSNSVWDLWCSTQELWDGDSIWKYYYKGSTFSSVIKGPCVLVKPGIWTRNIPCNRAVGYQLSQAVGGWYVNLIVHFKPQKLTPPLFHFLIFVEFSCCFFLLTFPKAIIRALFTNPFCFGVLFQLTSRKKLSLLACL